jgi:hypothetical protein
MSVVAEVLAMIRENEDKSVIRVALLIDRRYDRLSNPVCEVQGSVVHGTKHFPLCVRKGILATVVAVEKLGRVGTRVVTPNDSEAGAPGGQEVSSRSPVRQVGEVGFHDVYEEEEGMRGIALLLEPSEDSTYDVVRCRWLRQSLGIGGEFLDVVRVDSLVEVLKVCESSIEPSEFAHPHVRAEACCLIAGLGELLGQEGKGRFYVGSALGCAVDSGGGSGEECPTR